MRSKGRAGTIEQLLLVASLVAVAIVLAERDWLWRFDLLLYDASLKFVSTHPPDDIVVVAIDEESLSRLGRWPWSRRTHAALIDQLAREGARVIALDILFAEPDLADPGADEALATSVRNSARVVLPVVVEQPRAGGQLIERLPLPELADAAAALGHVHVELDADGLARGTHLLEGLARARWPALALAMLQLADPTFRRELPGVRAPIAPRTPARAWARDHRVLIPYIGRPGSVPRISYVHALEGRHPRDAFRERFVLVGVTATGMGDSLPTPVSGHGQPMPGVEINANLLQVLRTGSELRVFPRHWRIALCGLLAALPLLLYARLGPRYALVAALALLAAVLGLSVALMAVGRTWFGPAPLIVTIVASYPIWSWLRLETAMRYLRQELRRLSDEEADTALAGRPQLAPALDFLSRILPLDGWVVTDDAGRQVDGHGAAPAAREVDLRPGEWRRRGDALWAAATAGGRTWHIGARWSARDGPDDAERRLLTRVVAEFGSGPQPVPSDSVEVVQAQILRLQKGHARLRELHALIEDSLSQMADAAVVANNLGQVLIANERAAEYLLGSPGTPLVGTMLTELVAQAEPEDRERWEEMFRRVLVFGESRSTNVRHRDGRDLLVQLAPLARSDGGTAGLILNASDISELKNSQRRRDEMLSFLSHDLRSPLVSVLAVLELARSGRASDDPFDQVETYTRATIDLAEQFVELVRAESQESLRREEVDLVAVATNAVEQLWVQGHTKGITIESDLRVTEAWIRGDGSVLERALVNLLSNAIRHNARGTRVRIEVDGIDDTIEVVVSDDGRGLAAADRARLFQRFGQLAPSGERSTAGSGLGLAFVGVVVARHDGELEVDSRPGEGSRFTLRFRAAG